ncbi:MAG: DNA/RNA non-specific endonuclease [Bdellovibrionota bacterium]
MYFLVLIFSFSVFALERSLPRGKNGPVVEREGYAVQYNSDCKIPHWVSYRMKASDLVSNVKRTDDFRPDSEIRVPQAQLTDYKGSGFDRGHMARAGLFTRNKKVMSESFILSNIVPQDSYMNQSGAWRRLEDFEMNVITRDLDVNIVSGPVVGPNDARIGPNEVCVPEFIFKVLYRETNRAAIAFIIPNYRTDLKFTAYAVSVDELEKVTGIDFLPELEDNVEKQVEQSFDLSRW